MPAHRPQLKTAAFTLIELLVIILILAVLGSIVVPAYNRMWGRTKFEAMIGKVSSVFAYAREQAVSRDSLVTVRFEEGTQTFSVDVLPSAPVADVPVALMGDQATAEGMQQIPTRTLAMGQEFLITNFVVGNASSGDGLTVRYRGDGTCDGAQMVLASEQGYSGRLVVWPNTGRLRLEEEGVGQ